MGKRKKPRVFEKNQLNEKGTKELLGYLKRLHQCEEHFELSDMEVNEDLTDNETIYFKESDKWKTAYDDVRSILNDREHIETSKKADNTRS